MHRCWAGYKKSSTVHASAVKALCGAPEASLYDVMHQVPFKRNQVVDLGHGYRLWILIAGLDCAVQNPALKVVVKMDLL
eukprot:SAG11_NODE_33187_length_278_cov_2.463687_1_plen_78_part_01